jgi:hypothetical protein
MRERRSLTGRRSFERIMGTFAAALAQFLGVILSEIIARINWAALIPAVVQAAQQASTTTAINVPSLPEESAIQKEIDDAIKAGEVPGPGAALP